ncbi:hypothetical protein RR48_13815 [Papilio machaon]|uniref:Uncharacterized protein n=1 Tax=Papilio machaon TaxID=76193 RepID=A0A194RHP5_PAPMA|nr:hypothetical protein RR48_13815 [Papilio machaon]
MQSSPFLDDDSQIQRVGPKSGVPSTTLFSSARGCRAKFLRQDDDLDDDEGSRRSSIAEDRVLKCADTRR